MKSILSLSVRDPEVSGNGQPSVTAEHELDATGTYPSAELTHHSLLIRRMAQALRENLANSRFIANGDERPQKQRSISRRVRSVHFVLGRGRTFLASGA
ncbi:MAG TPA: hypothetical protein VGF37_06260 [Chthoniobacterales bacterium]